MSELATSIAGGVNTTAAGDEAKGSLLLTIALKSVKNKIKLLIPIPYLVKQYHPQHHLDQD